MTVQPKPAKALEPELVGVAKAFETYYNAHDADKLAALFTADGRLFYPFSETAEGPAAVRDLLREYFKERDPRNAVIEVHYTECPGDVTFSLGTTKSNIRLPDGTRADISGRWMSYGRCEPGGLKIAALMVTLDQPLPL